MLPPHPPSERLTPPRLAILADDFTGACDASGAFGAAGLEVVVCLQTPREPIDAAVVAVDLDVRERPADAAYESTRAVAGQLRALGCERLFAKIDSTLRGQVGAVVRGAVDGAGLRGALVAPAFPEQGRLLLGGALRLVGRDTAFDAPSLVALLGETAAGVELDVARAGPAAMRLAVERRLAAGSRLLAVDADSAACLRAVVEAWWARHDLLLAGSAGAARAARWALQQAFRQHPWRPAPERAAGAAGGAPTRAGRGTAPEFKGTVLVVAGSPAEATLQQIELLQRQADAAVVAVGPGQQAQPPAGGRQVAVLRTRPPEGTGRDAGAHAEAVAETAAAWARRFRPAGLVLVGGATARHLCELLGVGTLRVTGELAPGVPAGRLVGGPWDSVPVVTKAGGFGGPRQLLDAVRSFNMDQEDPA